MRKRKYLIALIAAVLVVIGFWAATRQPHGSLGYIDKTGRWAIAPQFAEARMFHGGLAFVWRHADFWHRTPFQGFIDRDGKRVIDRGGTFQGREALPPYVSVWPCFSEGLAAVVGGSPQWQMGFIDKAGRFVIQPRFDQARSFSEHLAAVQIKISDRWGFIDRSGKLVIKPVFDYVEDFHEGLAVVGVGKVSGNIYAGSDWMQPGHLGIAKWGFIDTSGKFVIPAQFSDCGDFSEGLAPACVGSRDKAMWGYIDRTGKWVIRPKFGSASKFSEGLALAGGDYIDKIGRVRVDLPNGLIPGGNFHDGLALVSTRPQFPEADDSHRRFVPGKVGYIDKTGKLVIPCEFGRASDFSEGRAAVSVSP